MLVSVPTGVTKNRNASTGRLKNPPGAGLTKTATCRTVMMTELKITAGLLAPNHVKRPAAKLRKENNVYFRSNTRMFSTLRVQDGEVDYLALAYLRLPGVPQKLIKMGTIMGYGVNVVTVLMQVQNVP